MKNNSKKFIDFHWLNRVNNLGLQDSSIIILILLSLVATITEIFGIGIFLPIFQFIRLNGDIDALIAESSLWGYVVEGFNYVSLEPSLLILLIISFSFFLSRQIFVYIRLIYTTVVRQRISLSLRNIIFKRYINADTSFHDGTPVGNLVNVITTEVNRAITGIMAPMDLIVYSIMLMGYIVILSMLSWKMTILSAVVLLLASRIPNVWIKKSAHTGRKLVNANMLMSEFLVGRLRSPRLVRLAGNEKAEKDEFYKLTQEQRKHTVFASILQSKTEVVMEPIVIGLSLIFLYFSYTVLRLQIEIIGLYLVIALRLLPIVKGVLSQWQTVQTYLGSIEIIESRLRDMEDSVEKDVGTKPIYQLKHSIMMDKISYYYPSNKEDYALTNISIEFKAGEMTALVGHSGSGKSTLIDLIPRLRHSTGGVVKIDGVDIKEYTLKSLRKIISYAPQSPQIFDGSVKSHILYGKVGATEQEVQEAAQLAGAEEFINKLPQGFDTILGEDAAKLSGGQRQRLDLARVLIRKAPILILDEPTSNLDAESEELFNQAIYRIRKKKNTAVIIVAHRLASIADADNIVVLNHGEIEASGSHSDLLGQNGWYTNAWRTQFSTAKVVEEIYNK